MAVGKAKVELFVIGNGASDEVVNGDTPVPVGKRVETPVPATELEVVSEIGAAVDEFAKGADELEKLKGPLSLDAPVAEHEVVVAKVGPTVEFG